MSFSYLTHLLVSISIHLYIHTNYTAITRIIFCSIYPPPRFLSSSSLPHSFPLQLSLPLTQKAIRLHFIHICYHLPLMYSFLILLSLITPHDHFLSILIFPTLVLCSIFSSATQYSNTYNIVEFCLFFHFVLPILSI